MALIQDEDSKDGNKFSIKGTCESTSKPTRKWTYNGIYMSSPKSETKERSSYIEEYSKSRNNITKKCPYNGIYLPSSNDEVKKDSNSIQENSKYEDEESVEINWDGELVSAMEELKKSRRSNKALKDKLEN